MAKKQREADPQYNAQGQRTCGVVGLNGKPCGRLPDRGQVHCYRHSQPRNDDGTFPKRGKHWTDARGVDTSYVDKLGISFDPLASDLRLELEIVNRQLHGIAREHDAAVKAVRAGREGPNPSALRAEMTALIQTKTRLVKAQTERLKLTNAMLTIDQAEVFYALLLYVVKRRGLSKEQWAEFMAELRVVAVAPWRISELKPVKGRGLDEVKDLFRSLWEERHGEAPPERTPPVEGDDGEDTDDEDVPDDTPLRTRGDTP